MSSVVIRDGKFGTDAWTAKGGSFHDFETLPLRPHDFRAGLLGIDISNALDPVEVKGFFTDVSAIRVPFPSFADGRGFSIAKRLRQLGFTGLLRAHGHVICDQYPLALRSGFDEIEISAELAERQPETEWTEAFKRVGHNYLDRLRRGAAKAA